MRSSRVLSLVAGLVLATFVLPLAPTRVAAQDGLKILVAPVAVTEPVSRKFGERISDEVRKALGSFAGYAAVDKGDVKDLIKQYDLDERTMSAIEWRQLAMQMQAALVMTGSAKQNGSGVEVHVLFTDPRNGDELPMEPFSVSDDDQHREAAEQVMTQLGRGVEYSRSIAFCADYLASEQVQDALNNCNTALELKPGSGRAMYLRGRTHMLAESWGAAVEDLVAVVADDPSDTEALQAIAYTYAQLGNSEESLKYYRQYLDFQPDAVAVRLTIAYDLATSGSYAAAVELLQDGLKRAPEDVQLNEMLGGVALNAGQSNNEVTDPEAIRVAVSALEKVVAAQGDAVKPSTLSNITSAYMLMEDYEDALAFSERALAMIQNPSASSGEGEDSDTPQASKEELLAQVHSSRAQIYDRMELPQEASTEFQRAMSYDPDMQNGHQRLAQFKLKAGDSEGAIADFRTAVQNGADADLIANALFGQGFKDHFEAQQGAMQNPAAINVGEVGKAIDLFRVAAEFARAPDTIQQVQFFIGFGYYLQGSAFDRRNESNEACGPARSALNAFQAVNGHLSRAGAYQPTSQGQIRDAVDVQLYRQGQIIEKSCTR